MYSIVDDVSAPVLALLLFFGSLALAALGRRLRARRPATGDTLYATTAIISLLVLLVSFTFSVALNRYDVRRDMVVEEAAAGFALWQRLQLQPPPVRAAMANTMKRYVDARLRYFIQGAETDRARPADAESDRLMEQMWNLARANVTDAASIRIITDGLTRVDDAAWRREAIAREHIPLTAIDMLNVALLLTGLSLGYSGHRDAKTAQLPHLLFLGVAAGTIGVLVDLDRPRSGLVRVSQAPMQELAAFIRHDMATDPTLTAAPAPPPASTAR